MKLITITPYNGTLKIVKKQHRSRPLIECWQAPELPIIVADPGIQVIMQTTQPTKEFNPLMKRAMKQLFTIQ